MQKKQNITSGHIVVYCSDGKDISQASVLYE